MDRNTYLSSFMDLDTKTSRTMNRFIDRAAMFLFYGQKPYQGVKGSIVVVNDKERKLPQYEQHHYITEGPLKKAIHHKNLYGETEIWVKGSTLHCRTPGDISSIVCEEQGTLFRREDPDYATPRLRMRELHEGTLLKYLQNSNILEMTKDKNGGFSYTPEEGAKVQDLRLSLH